MDDSERARLLAQLLRDYGGMRIPGRTGKPYLGYEEPGVAGRAKIQAFNAAGGPNSLYGMAANPAYLNAAQSAYDYENEMRRLIGRGGQVPFPAETEMGVINERYWPYNNK